MTKIRVEEVIPQGEYIKRLIDQQGVNNLFATQVTYLDDKTVIKLDELETKDSVSFTHDGDEFIIQKDIYISEEIKLENVLVKLYDKLDLTSIEKVKHYTDVSISDLLKKVHEKIVIKEIHYLDERLKTHLIWKDGEMV